MAHRSSGMGREVIIAIVWLAFAAAAAAIVYHASIWFTSGIR
jgi:hypothetical protein